jgi:hypothetical protein
VQEYNTLSDLFDSLWSGIKENSYQEENSVLSWLFSNKVAKGIIYGSIKVSWNHKWADSEKIDFLLSLDIENVMNYFTFSPPDVEKIDIEYVCYTADGSKPECEIEVTITRDQAFLLLELHEEMELKSA